MPGTLSPIGAALSNFGTALINRPTAQQLQQKQTVADVNTQKLADLQSAAKGREGLAAAFEQPGFDASNVGALSGNAIRGGVDNLADMILAFQANAGGTDDQVARALVGTGNPLGLEDAVSLQHQGALRADTNNQERLITNLDNEADFSQEQLKQQGLTSRNNADLSAEAARQLVSEQGLMDRQNAKPLTHSQQKGQLLGENFENLAELDPAQQQSIGAQPTSGGFTPQNYSSPDGSSGTTLDGVTDAATGQPLAQGTQVAPGAPVDLTKSVQTDVQSGLIETQDFANSMNQLRGVAEKDPTLFGIVGNVRRFGQDASGQVDAIDSAFGTDFGSTFGTAARDLQSAGTDSSFFDPNLSDVDKLATVTAYKAAAAVAGQSGRGLSDKDFQQFRQVIGDPTAWRSTQASFLAGLDQVEALVAEKVQDLSRISNGGALTRGDGAIGSNTATSPDASGVSNGDQNAAAGSGSPLPSLAELTLDQAESMSTQELEALIAQATAQSQGQ